VLRGLITALLFLVLAQVPGTAQDAMAPQLALVIGIDDYGAGRNAQQDQQQGLVKPPPLTGAIRDADRMADALESQGFAVDRATNLDLRALREAITAFSEKLTAAGPRATGVLYYAGHGASGQPEGEDDTDNYLIPLRTQIRDEWDLDYEAYSMRRITRALKPGADGAVIIILDACRDFPIPSRSIAPTRGLAETTAQPGTLIAYAAQPGVVASDAGYYAEALARAIRGATGRRLTDIFDEVRARVGNATNNNQRPQETRALRKAVYIGGPPRERGIVAERSQEDLMRELQILLTRMGYCTASSERAEDLIGWHVNRGDGEAADFYPAETFAETFRRPEKIAAALDGV